MGLLVAKISEFQLLVTANIRPISLLVFTLMMEAIVSSETSVPTSSTRCHVPQNGTLQMV
jgi:hypothetical protein